MSPKRFLHLAITVALASQSLLAAAPRAQASRAAAQSQPAQSQTAQPQTAQTQAAQPAPSQPATQDDLASRVAAVEKAFDEKRAEAGTPGASLVVVRGDRVVVLKGSGLRDAARSLPVTPDTLFAIGSCTKAFTALAALIAQDDGKLSLDDPPRKHLPYFKLADADADARVTLRDLLSHRTGLDGTDIAWYTGVLNREEVIRVAGRAKPTAKLGEKFQYQNVMYSAAGEVAARAEGTTWEQLVSSRILRPLGMAKTVLTVREMQAAPDYSLGYAYDPRAKQARAIPMRDLTNIAPAGAINSSAREMAEWLKFLVARGVAPDGRRLVSEKGFEEWLTPQIKANPTSDYALGWAAVDFRGHKLYAHNGGIDGFGSVVGFLPDEKIAFAALANVEDSPLLANVPRLVLANMVGPQSPAPAANAPAADAQEKPELFAGRYDFAAAKMTITVKAEGGKLYLEAPGQPRYTLQRVEGRRFRLAEAPGFFATFRPAQGDAVTEMYIEQPQGNYTLPRLQDGATAAPAAVSDALKELVGTYEVANGDKVVVSLKEGRIVLSVAGQPDYPLVEKSKDVYSTPLLPDAYSILARRDASGRITSLVLHQPEGEFEFKRAAGGDKPAPSSPAPTPSPSAATPAAAPSPAAGPTPPIAVEELMSKMIAAAGGEENLRRHKSVTTTERVVFENQGLDAEATTYAQAPNSYARAVTFTAFGKTIGTAREFFDGAAGGEETTFNAVGRQWDAAKLAEVRRAADFYSVLDWRTLYKKIEVKGLEKEDGEDAYVVVYTPEQGPPVTEYVSAKTFLVLRRVGTRTPVGGTEPVVTTTRFSDYREVSGVRVPFTVYYNVPGTGDATSRVIEVKFDAPLPADAFHARKK